MFSIPQLVDRGIAVANSLPKMFSGGWGAPSLLKKLIRRTNDFGEPLPIEVEWKSGKRNWRGLHIFEGSFASPALDLPLPEESREARFQLILPPDPFEGEFPPVAVHLAGTGDFTYLGRRAVAEPLIREEGIGALLLQNPFYGDRRPAGQIGTKLRHVTDQFLMNLATIEETRSLLRWLREDGYEHVGVTGYSMGGYMAALTAQLTPSPLAVVPCATGNTATDPIVYSPLSKLFDWKKLNMELPPGESAREHLATLMGNFAISRHGTLGPENPAIIVAGLQDEFIPVSEVETLHLHWSHSELRWIDAGHTTGWALHGDELRAALSDAFRRLRG